MNAPPTTLAEAAGGPRGIVESVVPTAVFLVAVTATAPVHLAAALAGGAAVLLVVARAVVRQPIGPALSGLVVVGLCVLAALRSGRATGFYVPGLLLNAGYALVLVVSTAPLPAIGRFRGGAVPLVGVVVAASRGAGGAWRADPAARRVASRLTWAWVGMFVVRLAVELPLYASGAATGLGIARIALGLPPFALLAWLTWSAVRSVPGLGVPLTEAPEAAVPDSPPSGSSHPSGTGASAAPARSQAP